MAGGEVLPDTVSYNTALKACGNAMQLQEALQVRSGSSQKGNCADVLEPKGSAGRHALPACTKCCHCVPQGTADGRHPTQCTNR